MEETIDPVFAVMHKDYRPFEVGPIEPADKGNGELREKLRGELGLVDSGNILKVIRRGRSNAHHSVPSVSEQGS